MGMYDEILCEYPLPKFAELFQGERFQTKDLDSLLDLYIIRADGLLVRRRSSQVVNEKDLDTIINIDGDVLFYTLTGDYRNKTNVWYEYRATFRDGRLTEIKCISPKELVDAQEDA